MAVAAVLVVASPAGSGVADRHRDRVYEEVADIASELSTWPQAARADVWHVSSAVHKWSRIRDLPAWLVVGVVRVENPWLIPDISSHAGAVGIMQVIPRFWLGVFPECGYDLASVDDNVCVGTGALRHFMERNGGLTSSLLAYNGCAGGGRCSEYPSRVLTYRGDKW